MPSWGEILQEINSTGMPPNLDKTRRKYLDGLRNHTKRNVILYASNWTGVVRYNPEVLSINEEDIQGFIEATHGLSGESLDLILHSPGGSAEVTENIVSYLRKIFKHIRVVIPQAAMSAATMLACAADEILMGRQSSLGPIDPQFVVHTQHGSYMQPAQAIIDNFEAAKEVLSTSPHQLGAYLPILNQYPPGLIERCRNAQDLSVDLAATWLEKYMLRGDTVHDAMKLAESLADHARFKSHSRHIDKNKAEELGLRVTALEDDPKLEDLAMSVFHATTITFQYGPVKIIENHAGNAFVKSEPIPSPPSGLPSL